jgi:soluble lytic murein transglycosylase-like protein
MKWFFITLIVTAIIPRNSLAEELKRCVVESLIVVESNGVSDLTGDDGKSFGLMQVQLPTARDLGFTGTVQDLMNSKINKKYGIMYLKFLLKRYGNLYVALDAYNRGMGNVERSPYQGDWRQHKYVGKILEKMEMLCSYPVGG